MPQGKMKVKAKLPDSVKKKKKGSAISKRGSKFLEHLTCLTTHSFLQFTWLCISDAPIVPKKNKNIELHKLKTAITKTVNATAEEELRAIALDGKKSLLSKKSKSKKWF